MSENLPATNDSSTKRDNSAVISASVSMMYAGAVPPPDIVEGYEKFCPGAAERFLRMAEQEQQSRIDADSRNSDNFRWGLVASTLIMILLFGFMFYCAYLGLESALIAALGVPLIGSIGSIIAQFVWRKK